MLTNSFKTLSFASIRDRDFVANRAVLVSNFEPPKNLVVSKRTFLRGLLSPDSQAWYASDLKLSSTTQYNPR